MKLSRKAYTYKKQVTANWIKEKTEADPVYKAGRTARSNLSSWFRAALISDYHDERLARSKKMDALFGVSTDVLFVHLLSTADEEVTPFNYGSVFEIDHIQPVSSFKNPLDAFTMGNVRLIRKEKNRPGRNAATTTKGQA